MWLLTIEDDEGLTTFHRLTREGYTIGRAAGSDLVLAQLDVSRRHARLKLDEGGWHFIDEGSHVGTFLNGRRLHGPAAIEDGDVVQIGGYVLRFSKAVPTGLPTPPPRYVAPARLRALSGLLAGEEHVFARYEIVTIGASDDCTLRLLHDRVSEVHAQILPLPDGRHELVDKSHNGLLFVNGRQVVGRHLLEGGDAINVGGVALLRYLEPSQQPDPRFDAVWAEGVAALPLEPLRASAPALRAARPSAALASADDDPIDILRANDARVEAVEPHLVPLPAPPSASFERLRRATMGRGDAAGGERAFVVNANGAPTADTALRWYTGSPAEVGGSGRERLAPEPPPPSGRSLTALTTPVDPETTPHPDRANEVVENGHLGPPESAEPQADAATRPRRKWSALVFPVAAAVALGATVGLQAPWPGAARLSSGATAPAAAGVEAAPAATSVVAPAQPHPAESPAVAASSALSAPVASAAPPSTSAAPKGTDAMPKRSGRLALLAARARSGRASGDELREMLSLCLGVGDARCAAEARAFLQGVKRGP